MFVCRVCVFACVVVSASGWPRLRLRVACWVSRGCGCVRVSVVVCGCCGIIAVWLCKFACVCVCVCVWGCVCCVNVFVFV